MIEKVLKGILYLGLIVVSASASSTTLNSYFRNRDGLRAFENKAYFPAYQNFLRALQDDPLNAAVQMNIARTFEANEDYEKADKAYRGILQLLPPESPLRFEVLFNRAGVLAKLKRIDEALGAYQAALEFDPNSIAVKTNIELLWKGGGGGGGDQKQNENQNPQQDPKQGEQPQQHESPKPKPFKSQELSQDDVKRILDEIKNQEQNIRAQDYQKGNKEIPKAKDW